MADEREAGFAWQVGVWERMAEVYQQEIDRRFAPIIQRVLDRAMLRPGEAVLDLGTGTGSVAILAATKTGPTGRVMAIDISPEMLNKARARIRSKALANVTLAAGRAFRGSRVGRPRRRRYRSVPADRRQLRAQAPCPGRGARCSCGSSTIPSAAGSRWAYGRLSNGYHQLPVFEFYRGLGCVGRRDDGGVGYRNSRTG